MGKGEEDQTLPSSEEGTVSSTNAGVNRCPSNVCKFVRVKCVVVLVFGLAVFLSAMFWLPPFLKGRDRSDLDLDKLLRAHQVVASFNLRKPVSVLSTNIRQLELDIFYEIGVPDTMVAVILLEALDISNATSVVFAVVHDLESSNISSASLSLLKANFESLLLSESHLHLTRSLFGDPTSFQVLKFYGGIKVIPRQNAFLLQKTQTLFNFTLNFSIHQILENFEELKDQLKSGLHLTLYENLYVSLKNSYGSTVAPPTTVEASILLAIGNLPPPLPRLKQLAQTITGSPARNLGLNHTVFGKVKQVRLSSVLQHSLNTGGNSGASASPSPAPLPPRNHYHRHHIHHPHHHRHQALSPAPAPAPERSDLAKPPSGCGIGKNQGQRHKAPAVAPVVSPRHSAASPHSHIDPPAPSSNMLPPSPLPSVVYAHAHPPNKNNPAVESPHVEPLTLPSPAPSSSNAGLTLPIRWLLALFLHLLVTHIL